MNTVTVTKNQGNISRTAKADSVPQPVVTVCGSIYVLFILFLILIVPILELYYGGRYINQCPINSNIPVYLIVAGAVGLAAIAISMITSAAMVCGILNNSGSSSISGLILAGISGLMFLFSLFLFAWLIVGSVWVFSVRNTVNLDNTTSSNYCQRDLYQFAFGIIILTYIMIGLSCVCSFVRVCIQAALSA